MINSSSLVTIALLVLVSFQGAKLARTAFSSFPTPDELRPLLADRTPPPPVKAPELVALQSQLLFGDPLGTDTLDQQLAAVKIKPQLAARLLGVLWSSDPRQSVAVLLHNDRQAAYRVGEVLDAGASVELVEVVRSSVVLRVDAVPLTVQIEPTRYAAAYRGELIPPFRR